MIDKYKIVPEDYTAALTCDADLSMEFTQFNKEAEAAFFRISRRFLAKSDMLYMKDVFITIIKELIANAIKANAKRVYFKDNNLDINNADDYPKGMKTFKADVIRPGSELLSRLIDTDYTVKIIFSCIPNGVCITVENNISMVPDEYAKIHSRIEKAYSYNDIGEAFAEALDDTEGAGLGLIMALMVFKNAGYPRDDFKIITGTENTSISFVFTHMPDREEFHNTITDKITEAINALPSLPENVMTLQHLCEDPEVSIKTVADFIRTDPSLAASILRLANSAGYITTKKIKTIDDAVLLIGLKGIKSIAMASCIDGIVKTRFREFKTIWEESYQKAFYAHKIAIQMKNASIAEGAYLAALLSKLGRIILLSVNKEVIEKITALSGKRIVPVTETLEEMALGISQTSLAALIIRKWKLDEELACAIEYGKKPHLAPIECREITYCVYLANFIVNLERKQFHFESADEDVLSFFKLTSEKNFNRLHNILIDAYKTQITNNGK